MEVFKQIKPIQEYLRKQRFSQKSIGLVPTMGALHDGHLSLLRACRQENDISVCSIFINPAQFNNAEDLKMYPRQYEKDLSMLEQEGCDAVFLPETHEIYGDDKTVVQLGFGELETVMEGKFRPGHFHGVGLIVTKLFHIISPDTAYFGQKDLQQFAIIRQLVKDLSFQVNLSCEPIVREADGLAMSSRNMRLSPEERKKASSLYAALQRGKESLLAGISPSEIIDDNLQWLDKQGIAPEYFEIVDAQTLQPIVNHFDKKSVALCVAGHVGPVRLIDNIVIESKG